MDRAFNRLSVILAFILPAFLVYTLLVIVAIVWAAGYSFFNWDGLGSMDYAGFANYVQLLTADSKFATIIAHTLTYTLVEILIQVFGGLALAIFLTRLGKGRALLQTLYYIPVVISSVAICQIFLKLLSVFPTGVVNAMLGALNPSWGKTQWVSNPAISLFVVAFVEGYKYCGIYMVIFYAALIAVPNELVEAASIDGASVLRQYVSVKIPYIKPVIITNCVLVLNGSMRSFDISYLLTKGGPGYSSELLATYMYKQAFTSMKYGYGSAVAICIVAICLLIGFVFNRVSKAWGENGL